MATAFTTPDIELNNVDDFTVPTVEFDVRVSAISTGLEESDLSDALTLKGGNLSYTQIALSDGDWYYVVDGFINSESNVLSIPRVHPTDKKPILKIAERAFMVRNGVDPLTDISKVVIPNSIIEIGKEAFKGSSVTEIVFEDFEGLTSATLEKGLILCLDMTDATAYFSVKCDTIDGTTDISCPITILDAQSKLKRIYVPMESNRSYYIEFSNSVMKLPKRYTIDNIKETPENGRVLKITTNSDGEIEVTRMTTLPYYVPSAYISGLKIGDGAFNSCQKLKNFRVPGRTSEIGDGAFANIVAQNFEHDYFGILKKVGITAYYNMTASFTNNFQIYLPECLTEMGSSCFNDSSGISVIHIPKGVKKIPQNFAEDCENLTTVYGGDNVEEISKYAFKNCSKLKAFTIYDKVLRIGRDAFSGCFYHDVASSENLDNGAYEVTFMPINGWFVTEDEADFENENYEAWEHVASNYISPNVTIGKKKAAAILSRTEPITSTTPNTPGYASHYWKRLTKMVTPELTPKGGTKIQITDPLGIATEFYIHVNGQPKVKIWP
jgi:hypothetical protein